MRAARFHGAGDIRVEDIPDLPAPGSGEVQVKVEWCGICGTDMHEYSEGPILVPPALASVTLGHEFSGQIVATGDEVSSLTAGDWVTASSLLHCGACFHCLRHQPSVCSNLSILGLSRDGALAEYLNVPAWACVRIPEGLSPEEAALAEPAAGAVRALRKGRVQVGETVAVVGLGAIGLMAVRAARLVGAARVIAVGRGDFRKETAGLLGADAVLDPGDPSFLERFAALTDGRGADVVVELAGSHDSLELACELTCNQGRTVLMGVFGRPVSVNATRIVTGEKELIGSCGFIYDEEFAATVNMMADGRLQLAPLITSRIKLDEVIELGFRRIHEDKRPHLRVLVSPR